VLSIFGQLAMRTTVTAQALCLETTMSPGSRSRMRSESNTSSQLQPKALTRSPPPSPEQNPRARGPSPISSSNSASQYTLLEKLGTGSFGTVYKGVHNDTKQIVAIKQIGE
jgi:serine/threonine-protein kinase 24/25/MST4